MIVTAFGHLDTSLQVPSAQPAQPAAQEATPRPRRRAGFPGDVKENPAAAAAAARPVQPEPVRRCAPAPSPTARTRAEGEMAEPAATAGAEPAAAGTSIEPGPTAVADQPAGGTAAPAGAASQTARPTAQGIAPAAAGRPAPVALGAGLAPAAAAARTAAEPAAAPGRAEGPAGRPAKFTPHRILSYRSPVQGTAEVPAPAGEAILRRIALFLDPEGGEAVLDLDPPSLGRLAIQLNVEGEEVTLRVHASSEAAARFLERNLEPLRAALAAQELCVAGIQVTAGQDGGETAHFAREAERRARAGRGGSNSVIKDIEAGGGPGPEAAAARRNLFGPASLLDLLA